MHNIGIDGRVLEAALRQRSLVITARKNGNAGTHESKPRNPHPAGPPNKAPPLSPQHFLPGWIFASRTFRSGVLERVAGEGDPFRFDHYATSLSTPPGSQFLRVYSAASVRPTSARSCASISVSVQAQR